MEEKNFHKPQIEKDQKTWNFSHFPTNARIFIERENEKITQPRPAVFPHFHLRLFPATAPGHLETIKSSPLRENPKNILPVSHPSIPLDPIPSCNPAGAPPTQGKCHIHMECAMAGCTLQRVLAPGVRTRHLRFQIYTERS